MRHIAKTRAATQRGATLIIVLILLLIMTLLALASMRGTLLEERMSANQFDRSLSFQAAEAALRKGEEWATSRPAVPASGCVAGLCAIPDPEAPEAWKDETVWANARQIEVQSDELIVRPKYIVELLADDVPPKGSCTTTGDISEVSCTGSERRYRITARSQDEGRAAVVLQSIYAVP